MPTILGREFPPVVVYTPTHMSVEDVALYKRWAPSGLKNALHQWFDVGLGKGAEIPPGTPPEMERMWRRVNQKRADAVIEYVDRVEIVEFRAQATLNVFGRLLGYEMLWKDDPVVAKTVVLRVVSDREDPEMRRMADKLGIRIDFV